MSGEEIRLREGLSEPEFLHRNLHFIINVLERRPDLPTEMHNLIDLFTGYTVFDQYEIRGPWLKVTSTELAIRYMPYYRPHPAES